jgi:hypothetical protein
MSAGPVSDRVYANLRQRILSHAYRPGARLDAADLADTLSSSVTPVRDALNRLAGEGLVEAHSGEGFNLPAVDEPGLADLYRWSADLIDLAAAHSPSTTPDHPSATVSGENHATRTAALFAAIAARSDNVEHARAVGLCNARLSAARMVEPDLFTDTDAELTHLAELARAGPRALLRPALRRYHACRVKRASALVRLLYRSVPGPASG